MKAARIALLALACCLPLAASAQWQWLDNAGRKVFSDRPPPPDVPANRILKQPGVRSTAAAAPAAPEAVAAAPAAAASLPKPSGKDKVLEEKKKQAEAAEAEKKKAEEAKVAAARADNCARARSSKATFDSGVRVSRTNEKGEREILDDAQRAAEVKHLDTIIARDCKQERQ
jgi:type IV secretory pathway VirB10-like protein